MAWYTKLLGVEPYFARPVEGTPVYVEFRIGDYQHELGIVDSRFAVHTKPDAAAGPVTYWHVDDVQGSFGRLLALGATVHEKPIERGPGFRHRVGRRPVRQHPGRHVQQALPGSPRLPDGGLR